MNASLRTFNCSVDNSNNKYYCTLGAFSILTVPQIVREIDAVSPVLPFSPGQHFLGSDFSSDSVRLDRL